MREGGGTMVIGCNCAIEMLTGATSVARNRGGWGVVLGSKSRGVLFQVWEVKKGVIWVLVDSF